MKGTVRMKYRNTVDLLSNKNTSTPSNDYKQMMGISISLIYSFIDERKTSIYLLVGNKSLHVNSF